MIKVSLTNGMLTRLLAIERAKERFGDVRAPIALSSRLRKSSKKKITAFAPVDLARALKVSNRTVINWCVALVKNGFLVPDLSGQRIRSYSLTKQTCQLLTPKLGK